MKKKKNIKNEEELDKNLWSFHQSENKQSLSAGHLRQDMLYKKIINLIRKGKILEIGFGDGYLLKKLSKKYKCYGADISPINIKQIQNNVPAVSFSLVETSGKLPYKDNFFDGFVASEVLEHMNDKELEMTAKEIKRVLKPKGKAILTVPAQERLEDNQCFCPYCKAKFHRWGHKQTWNETKIKNVFKDFQIETIKIFFTPYQGNNLKEKFLGKMMWIIRTIIGKFIFLKGGNYLIILEKKHKYKYYE